MALDAAMNAWHVAVRRLGGAALACDDGPHVGWEHRLESRTSLVPAAVPAAAAVAAAAAAAVVVAAAAAAVEAAVEAAAVVEARAPTQELLERLPLASELFRSRVLRAQHMHRKVTAKIHSEIDSLRLSKNEGHFGLQQRCRHPSPRMSVRQV